MADITVSSPVATAGLGQIFLAWEYDDPNVGGLSYQQLDMVEVWSATANQRSQAVRVAEGKTDAVHVTLSGTARWYWFRARDRGGAYGPWVPSSATAGLAASEVGDLGSGIKYWQLPGGFIFQWGATVPVYFPAPIPVSFRKAFPNAVFVVLAGQMNLDFFWPFPPLTSDLYASFVVSSDQAQLTVQTRFQKNASTQPSLGAVNWLALGY